MTVKFTKIGVGKEQNDESLLFEFLDHELSETMDFKYESELATAKFVGSLQTNQLIGIYLEPISWSGEMYATYVSQEGKYISAKERYDMLARLQGRIVKFWYEGIKQLIIIKSIECKLQTYYNVKYSITIQPHDIQIAIKPTEVQSITQKSYLALSETKAPSTKGLPQNLQSLDLGIQNKVEKIFDKYNKEYDYINQKITNIDAKIAKNNAQILSLSQKQNLSNNKKIELLFNENAKLTKEANDLTTKLNNVSNLADSIQKVNTPTPSDIVRFNNGVQGLENARRAGALGR